MAAVYNLVWDASYASDGIREYQVTWTDNGAWNSSSTPNQNMEISVGEGNAIHVEVRAVCNCGQQSDAAVLDFTAEVRGCTCDVECPCDIDAHQGPSSPANLRADFIRFD